MRQALVKRLLAIALAGTWASQTHAFTMSASAAEVAALPQYCAARLAEINSFNMQGRKLVVSPAEVQRWQETLGTAYAYVHHLCGGMIWLQRGRVQVDQRERTYALGQALYETTYTFDRVPDEEPFFAVAATQMGMVHRARKEYSAATRYFAMAMDKHPGFPDSYQAAALTLQDQGKLQEASAVLMRGLEATGGQSADIHYSMGLLYLKMKRLDEAEKHGRRAYELGYPLPALKNKLAAAGRPID